MPAISHPRHRASLRRFFAAFTAVACAVVVWTCLSPAALPGFAAQSDPGYYGTPLRFDPPPVDLRDSTVDLQQDETYRPQPAQPDSVIQPQQQRPARQAQPPAENPVRPQAERRVAPVPPAPEPEIEQVQSFTPEPEQDAEAAAALPDEPQEAAQPGKRAQPKSKPIRLFGTVEFRCVVKDLPKWERVFRSEKKAPSFTANGLKCQKSQVEPRWLALKEKLQGASLMEKAKAVNGFFNQWPYKTDKMLWGLEDYWATPCEFMTKSGDCEDYAIAKYYALRDLGVPANLMRVAAVKNSISGIGHAVMVIFIENEAYVLDNLTNLVLSHKRLSHYRPLYTVNEEYMWRHVKPVSGPKK